MNKEDLDKFKKFWKEKYISFYLSLAITIGFTIYNAFLGLQYYAIWNGSMAIYYIFLLIIKCIVCFGSKRINDQQRDLSLKKYIFSSSLTIAITLALIVPSILMIRQERPVNLSKVAAITVAAFTTYKIIMAIKNYVSNKNNVNLYNKQIYTINLVSAIVSILTLQNTLIAVESADNTEDMKILSIVSTICMLIIIIFIAVKSLIDGIKLKKKKI